MKKQWKDASAAPTFALDDSCPGVFRRIEIVTGPHVPPLRMREASPIASGTRPAFVDGTDEKGEHFGGVADLPFVSYAPTPEGFLLRRLRQALGLYLGEAGRALGLQTVEMSWLERGWYLLDGEAFREACDRLCAAARRKGR